MYAPVTALTCRTEPPSRAPPSVPAACHPCSRFRLPERWTIELESPTRSPLGQVLMVGSHSFPVDTHTFWPLDVAATLDHTLPPIEPLGTLCHVCTTAPVCWSSSTTPPWISGLSQREARPM